MKKSKIQLFIDINLLLIHCLLFGKYHCFFVRPVELSNGTIVAEIIETDNKIRTPGDAAVQEIKIDMTQFEFPLTAADVEWLSSLLELPVQGECRLRKEYRVMAEGERKDFHRALNILKNDTSVSLNKYDLLANIHSRSSANKAAHTGPGFLGWHRVFLLMTENALRQVVPGVTIPYWDTTLEEGLPKPYESILWTPKFLGTSDGDVREGPFLSWETPFGFGHLKRQIMAQGRLLSEKNINNIMQQRHLGDINYFNAKLRTNIEALHNRVHVWVGGQMRKIEIGAYDPIFFLLHSFVDLIWEQFRLLQRERGIEPEIDYPEHYGKSTHSPFTPMGIGSLFVIDGISNIWNENIRYELRPTCNTTKKDCGSLYLKCDVLRNICVSKTVNDDIAMELKSKVDEKNVEMVVNKITQSKNNDTIDDSLTSDHRTDINNIAFQKALNQTFTLNNNKTAKEKSNGVTQFHRVINENFIQTDIHGENRAKTENKNPQEQEDTDRKLNLNHTVDKERQDINMVNRNEFSNNVISNITDNAADIVRKYVHTNRTLNRLNSLKSVVKTNPTAGNVGGVNRVVGTKVNDTNMKKDNDLNKNHTIPKDSGLNKTHTVVSKDGGLNTKHTVSNHSGLNSNQTVVLKDRDLNTNHTEVPKDSDLNTNQTVPKDNGLSTNHTEVPKDNGLNAHHTNVPNESGLNTNHSEVLKGNGLNANDTVLKGSGLNTNHTEVPKDSELSTNQTVPKDINLNTNHIEVPKDSGLNINQTVLNTNHTEVPKDSDLNTNQTFPKDINLNTNHIEVPKDSGLNINQTVLKTNHTEVPKDSDLNTNQTVPKDIGLNTNHTEVPKDSGLNINQTVPKDIGLNINHTEVPKDSGLNTNHTVVLKDSSLNINHTVVPKGNGLNTKHTVPKDSGLNAYHTEVPNDSGLNIDKSASQNDSGLNENHTDVSKDTGPDTNRTVVRKDSGLNTSHTVSKDSGLSTNHTVVKNDSGRNTNNTAAHKDSGLNQYDPKDSGLNTNTPVVPKSSGLNTSHTKGSKTAV